MNALSTPTNVLDTVPLTIDEGQTVPFKFYFNQAIRTGMQYHGALYGLVQEVAPSDRLEAYHRACELLRQGLPVLVTVSRSRYALWLKLNQATESVQDLLK